MNQTLLAYEITVPDFRQPFTFAVPQIDRESLADVECRDNILTFYLVASSKTPTRSYTGRVYQLNEPFERPKISKQRVIRWTHNVPGPYDEDDVLATERIVLIIEPDIEEAKQEVTKELREKLGAMGPVIPTEVLRAIAESMMGLDDEDKNSEQ